MCDSRVGVGLDNKRVEQWGRHLFRLSLLNLLLLSLAGILLRSFPFLPGLPFDFKNLLHGHSHFAFGGWVIPAITALVMQYFPEISSRISIRHWKWIIITMLVSAYGMLASFPFMGYKALSIGFSSLSIFAVVHLTWQVREALPGSVKRFDQQLLRSALYYGCIASLGAVATGPIMALGGTGSVLYFDAIYFYLHFEYNGFFSLALLALLLRRLAPRRIKAPVSPILIHLAIVLSYALSVLWSKPHPVVYAIGGIAAILQLLVYTRIGNLLRNADLGAFKFVLLALALKLLLQVASFIPFFADLAYRQRSIVIAYLHLVLLGFISMGLIQLFFKEELEQVRTRNARTIFLGSFVFTEILLLMQGLGLMFPAHHAILLLFSAGFPLGALGLLRASFSFAKKPGQHDPDGYCHDHHQAGHDAYATEKEDGKEWF